MSDRDEPGQNPSPSTSTAAATAAPATLGDVLYDDKSAPRTPEGDWVALVVSIAAGDQQALRALYDRTHRIVFTLMVRITNSRETAEELTVDVFHDVWRRAGNYRPADGTVIAWIMNQARSRAIDRLRFEQRKKRVAPAEHAAAGNGADTAATASERYHRGRLGEVFKNALTALTEDERRAIETAYFGELTYAEAAEQLGEPLGTIKTRVRSGLGKLRDRLDSERNDL